jgi:hypothetical protein
MTAINEALIEKIRQLGPEQRLEVEDFVDFLRERRDERALVRDAAQSSTEAFAKVWDNADDAIYDRL